MSFNISGVENSNKSVSKNDTFTKNREMRANGNYIITKKKMTLSEIAKKFGMSVDEFKKRTGIKSSSLTAGTIIKNVPTAQIPSGKGLMALAREYGMTLTELCDLNGIDKNYPPQKGEKFYVKYIAEKHTDAKSETSEEMMTGEAGLAVPELDSETKAEVAKIKTADEIAKALYEEADNKRGAVGKDKFNAVFAKLNTNNINDILRAYNEISPKETMINMISSEWGSEKCVRKAAIMRVYDLLAEKAGAPKATEERRKAFIQELNDEFNSFGTVSTKKLDKMIFNMSKKTPEEIAEALKNTANGKGFIDKDDFQMPFSDINKNNVIEVLQEYDKIKGNGWFADSSLLYSIASDWKSSQESRKNAITRIYDLVAEKVGNNIATPDKRQVFIDELNNEFDSFGMVSTDKMDEILNSYIYSDKQPAKIDETEPPAKKKVERTANTGNNASHLSGNVYPNEIFYTTNGGNSKDITPTTMTTIKDRSGNYVNAGTLKKWAINGAKRDEGFKGVKNPFIMRPLPNYNTETKKIEAVTEVLEPNAHGNLDGKVIILNPGHGGYQQANGYFDPGTVLSVENAEGELMPIEEWRVAQSYVDKLADNLRNRGAKLVIISGAAQHGGMDAQNYIENMLAGKKGDDAVRELMLNTDKQDMLFLSIHVESVKNPKETKCSVKYTKAIDKKLSENIQKYINIGFPTLTPKVDYYDLYVNNATKGIPSSLIEVGNIANKSITNSLLSSFDQKKYAECVANAIEDTMLN